MPLAGLMACFGVLVGGRVKSYIQASFCSSRSSRLSRTTVLGDSPMSVKGRIKQRLQPFSLLPRELPLTSLPGPLVILINHRPSPFFS